MSSIYLWLIYLDKIKIVLMILGWGFFICFLIGAFIIFMMKVLQTEWYHNEDYKNFINNIYPTLNKIFIILCITGFIFGMIGVFIPNKKELITIYVLKQVDKYNSEHETSVFNPDNIMEGADKKLDKISDIIDKSLNKIDNMLDEKK